MAHHRLGAGPDTVHWGWFDAELKPALTVDSGDRITVETVSGGPANLPGDGFHVPPELFAIRTSQELHVKSVNSPQVQSELRPRPERCGLL